MQTSAIRSFKKGGEDNSFDNDLLECNESSESSEILEETSETDGEEENMKAMKPITQKELDKFHAKIEKSGVCYMSRVPPFMKHTVLRQMLSKYGDLARIYLNPEDSKIAAKRKKYKKNKRVNYVEGWIEFADKKVARKVALLLNNNNMGGKKRSYYYDDIWNIKYLPKFKWNNLTEQLAYELKVKEQKMRNEMSQAKRENKLYVKNVQKAKMIEAIEAKKGVRAKEVDNITNRIFRQRKAQQ